MRSTGGLGLPVDEAQLWARPPVNASVIRLKLMRNILLCATLLLISGCSGINPQPFDDQRIAIVSNTWIQSVSVGYPDGANITLPPDHYDLFRTLFRALAPIDQVSRVPGLPGLPDYHLTLCAAGNVANIDVMIKDSKLIWMLDGFQYQGGDTTQFLNAAEAIRGVSVIEADG
jgi:hypothetical protein